MPSFLDDNELTVLLDYRSDVGTPNQGFGGDSGSSSGSSDGDDDDSSDGDSDSSDSGNSTSSDDKDGDSKGSAGTLIASSLLGVVAVMLAL